MLQEGGPGLSGLSGLDQDKREEWMGGKGGRMEGWKGGRGDGRKSGRVEGWKGGRGKDGKVEGWKRRREKVRVVYLSLYKNNFDN